jgi:hypothetical protein
VKVARRSYRQRSGAPAASSARRGGRSPAAARPVPLVRRHAPPSWPTGLSHTADRGPNKGLIASRLAFGLVPSGSRQIRADAGRSGCRSAFYPDAQVRQPSPGLVTGALRHDRRARGAGRVARLVFLVGLGYAMNQLER